MRSKILIVALTFIAITACNKDQFTTKPQLKFSRVNTQVLAPEQVIIFTLHYTDKEGDIQDSLYVNKIVVSCPNSDFTALYQIPPDVPQQKNAEGDIEVRYGYGTDLNYPQITTSLCSGNDTCVFRFALSDRANNTSDTVVSPTIILLK